MKRNIFKVNPVGFCSRSLIILIILFNVLSFSCSTNKTTDQYKETEILWDKFNVPHIYAKNKRDMYYAFAWAQMNNHANLILKLYAQARGSASEYLGSEYINSDKKIRLFKLPELAKISYEKQDDEYASYLDAFVEGINDYASSHPETIDKEYVKFFPVTAYDVLSHTIRVICLEFLASGDIYNAQKLINPGSNAMAISASNSSSGNTMLLSNPHLPWSDFFLWFEAHLNTSEINAYGVALVGMPVLTIAFNQSLGWTHTVNTIDASDRYELDLAKDGYLIDKKIVPFETKSATIKVKQDDGTLKEQTFEFKYSLHGPVIGEIGDKAYAIRIAGLNNSGIFEQYHKMTKASNLFEFESALKMLQNPMFNVIYADKSGNILYVFNGNVPKRTQGDYSFWRGTIDGTDSKLVWDQTHPYDDLPRVLNPKSGFVQNCNDPPWTCTYPTILDPKNFPSYMAPMGMNFRPQRAVNMIKDNKSISFDQMVGYKHNTGMEMADRFLDDLLDAVEKFPNSKALESATVLRSWDRKTEINSRGAVLFASWCNELRSYMFEVPWSFNEPVSTPHGFKDNKQVVDLLVKAAKDVELKYGSLDVAWGEVFRFQNNGKDYPANGGPGRYGIFRTMNFTRDADNKNHVIAGDTYVAITEFGEKVKAQVLLSYGNVSQPGIRQTEEQLQMLSEKKLRPALLDKEDILKNLEKRESLCNDVIN
jgi:acyl-homoserine-lactone acylase